MKGTRLQAMGQRTRLLGSGLGRTVHHRTRMFRPVCGLWALVIFAGIQPSTALSTPHPREGATAQSDVWPLPAAQAVLRVARSDDGLDFIDSGEVFVPLAAAPDLVRLPDGDLLALFDYAAGRTRKGATVMAVSRSGDEGETWSPLQAVRLEGLDARVMGGRYGDFVQTRPDHLRLFFAAMPRKPTTQPGDPTHDKTLIHSAVTRDGVRYHLVPATGVRLGGDTDLHPTAFCTAGGIHVYAARLMEDRGVKDKPHDIAYHVVSRDGRRFVKLAPAHVPDVRFVGSVLPVDHGFRAYVTSKQGVRSLFSKDGRKWDAEEGVRLENAWDPAVVRLKDGSFFMLYCATRVRESVTSSCRTQGSSSESNRSAAVGGATEGGVRVSASSDGAAAEDCAEGEFDYDQWAREMGEPGLVPLPSGEELALLGEAPLIDPGVVRSVAKAGDPGAPAEAVDDATERHGESWTETLEADFAADRFDEPTNDDELSFAPKPDLENHINYFEWFQQHMTGEVGDSAWDIYSELLAHPWDESDGGSPLPPDLVDMFSDNTYDGPPGPWHPATHPRWEASNRAVQELLSRFRDAGLSEEYARPMHVTGEKPFGSVDGEPMLIDMLLPSLRDHRALVKATLADAWRIGADGRVSPERTLDAWETVLRNAEHLRSGTTLIENLVGIAEQAMVETNARWALKHGVFDEHELEQALDVLTEYDIDDRDPAWWLRGEHAMSMQTVQVLFEGTDGDGPDLELAARVAHLVGGGDAGEDRLRRIAAMTRDDAHAAIDAFDVYYRELGEQMRTGYPNVRAADMDATAERYVHTNALTEILLPSLSRVQVLRTRNETLRRATQLSYAVHLFEAHHGRWPGSLDELSAEYGARMRTDPFTGRDFGYRLTEGGPTIYSLSENGLDDGGVHSFRWGDEITNETESDDHVFWPPQERR